MRVVISTERPEQWHDLPSDVEAAFCGYGSSDVDAVMDPATVVLVTDALPTITDRCAGLRWVQLLSAGANQMQGHPLAQRDLLLANAAGISADYMAEHVVAQVLSHAKSLRTFDRLQRQHNWPNRVAMARPGLRGTRALIIGYGGVGRETARLLNALGMTVDAVTADGERRPYHGYVPYTGMGDPEARIPERMFRTADLLAALPMADVVVLALPLTPDTRHVIGAAALKQMRPSAILVNVARGGLIDTQSLLAALDAGRFAAAYLDVFEPEPLPPDSPLWDHPLVSVTPHMAGVIANDESRYRDLFLQNLARFRAGEPLINQIDRRRFLAPT
jgi:phosphoglycerate dehydrogenase-like enzyme